MLKHKIELRAQLAIETAKIEEALSGLDESGAQELVHILSEHQGELDQDIDTFRAAAEARAREEAEARGFKPLSVPLTRTSSRLLVLEVQRRLADGYCAPLETLAEQAIRQCYGQ